MVLLVWRCGLVDSPGGIICTQQPMVGMVGPPVIGCEYSSSTPSWVSRWPEAQISFNARSASRHL